MTKACDVCGASDWGTRNRCNPCRAKRQREERAASAEIRTKDRERLKRWRGKNPTKVREQDLRRRYSVDGAEFAALLAEQNGLCAICRSRRATCVDHAHDTGVVRGILCRHCNAGLGQFRDDPQLILAAASYLDDAR